MKLSRRFILPLLATLTGAALLSSAHVQAEVTSFEQTKPLRIALVSFKTCVEKSKIGQKEQSGFDAMKKQMESILVEKEKTLTEIAAKFNNIDYLDSLSPEAERELKNQYRTLSQEFQQQQQQFYQTLSQANVLIVQKLNEAVTKASKEVAKKNQIDLVLNEESAFFFADTIDVSPMVVRIMDENFEKDSKDAKPSAPAIK